MEKPNKREKRAIIAFFVLLVLTWLAVEFLSGSIDNEFEEPIAATESFHSEIKGTSDRRPPDTIRYSKAENEKKREAKTRQKDRTNSPPLTSPLEKPVKK